MKIKNGVPDKSISPKQVFDLTLKLPYESAQLRNHARRLFQKNLVKNGSM